MNSISFKGRPTLYPIAKPSEVDEFEYVVKPYRLPAPPVAAIHDLDLNPQRLPLFISIAKSPTNRLSSIQSEVTYHSLNISTLSNLCNALNNVCTKKKPILSAA